MTGIGQAALELLSFKLEYGNHQRGISSLQKLCFWKCEAENENDVTYEKPQFPNSKNSDIF